MLRFNWILDDWLAITKLFCDAANEWHKKQEAQSDAIFKVASELLLAFFQRIDEWVTSPVKNAKGKEYGGVVLGEAISLADFCILSLYHDLVRNETGHRQRWSRKLQKGLTKLELKKMGRYVERMRPFVRRRLAGRRIYLDV